MPAERAAQTSIDRIRSVLWHRGRLAARAVKSALSLRFDPLALLYLLCAALALRALLVHGLDPINQYDEGVLLTNAQMMSDGRVIYRDFYANYPPGIFQIVRVVNALGLPCLWSMRLLSLLVRVASAWGAGWLVGRVRGPGLKLATATLVLILQAQLGLTPYAYSFAVLLVLLLIACWPEPGASRARRILCGVLLAALSYLRHDLFSYAAVLLGSVEAAFWLLRRRSFFLGSLRELTELAASLGVGLLVLWLPVFVRAGVTRTLHDLVIDQVLRVMPARVLPIPPLFDDVEISSLDLTAPAFCSNPVLVRLALTVAGVVAGVLLSARRTLREPAATRGTRITALVTLFAIATLPQALQRTDAWHVGFGLPLALAALFMGSGRWVALPALVFVLLPWFAKPPSFIRYEAAKQLWEDRADTAFLPKDRARLAKFVQTQVDPEDPIFVGCVWHLRAMRSSVDIYYWVHRPGATRYMQFDPGLVNSEVGQAEMITDLQRTQPRLALLESGCAWDEPNDSMHEGATTLDEYMHAHYRLEGQIGPFEIWRRSVRR